MFGIQLFGRPKLTEIAENSYRVEIGGSWSQRESVLAFSHYKAGSSMYYRILQGLSQAAGLKYVSIPAVLFSDGIEPSNAVEADIRAKGFCYAGFRAFPRFEIPILDSAKTTLLVRDPRDILVSWYFSVRDSHVIPKPDSVQGRKMLARREEARGTTIDEWVLSNAVEVARTMTPYLEHEFPTRSNVAIYRYEDVIFRKREWIGEVVQWYGWKIPDRTIDRVVARHDVFPTVDDPTKHIRQVKPGNYRTALTPATQDRLTESLSDVLAAFGYESKNAEQS